MMERSAIPSEIIDMLELKEPKKLEKIVTLIQDTKHTKQFSIKFPVGFIERVRWEAGDKILIKIEMDTLQLKKQ